MNDKRSPAWAFPLRDLPQFTEAVRWDRLRHGVDSEVWCVTLSLGRTLVAKRGIRFEVVEHDRLPVDASHFHVDFESWHAQWDRECRGRCSRCERRPLTGSPKVLGMTHAPPPWPSARRVAGIHPGLCRGRARLLGTAKRVIVRGGPLWSCPEVKG